MNNGINKMLEVVKKAMVNNHDDGLVLLMGAKEDISYMMETYFTDYTFEYTCSMPEKLMFLVHYMLP